MPHRKAMVGIAGGGCSSDAAEPLTPLGSLTRACSPTRGERWRVLPLAFLLSLAAFALPVQAEKVGVAAAVNPDAFSSLSGVPNKQLNIGKSIFYNERINTSGSGLVQVLLVDGSTFTVGPNSDLVIDKFVYDPRKKTGEMVATFSKGTMRFIGGKLSKNEGGVQVKTPAGALAIRGGMFQGSTSRGIYSFLYGHSMTFRGRNGQSQTIYQPGYTLDLSGGNADVRPTTPEDTNVFMQALSSGSTNFGSGTGTPGNPANPNQFQQASDLDNAANELTSDANFVMVQTAIQEQLVRLTKLQETQNGPNPPQSTPTDPTGPGEPVDPGDPVIKNGGTFNGYASGFLQTGENGTGQPEFLVDGSSRIILDPETDSVAANIKVTHVEQLLLPKTTSFNLGFGGSPSNSTYVDDNTFLALGDDGSTSVVRTEIVLRWVQTGRWPWQGRFEREEQVQSFQEVAHSGNMTNVPALLCEKCNFLKYGFWASDVTYGPHTDKMGGWWIGTKEPPISSNDMPTTGEARYEGLAVGTFATRASNSNTWAQTAGATGDMSMDWDFGKRLGRLQIDDFGVPGNQKSFGGPMIAPGRVDFAGPIAGGGGVGAARGSFVGSGGPGTIPKGVMGDFGITGNHWKANGIFGGGVVPNQVVGQ